MLVALNKSDLVKDKSLIAREEEYIDSFLDSGWPFFRCSALNGQGCNELMEALVDHLPIGPKLYPSDMKSDQPEQVLLAELIREQVLIYTKEEIPHSVAVVIERLEELSAKKGKNKNQGVKNCEFSKRLSW